MPDFAEALRRRMVTKGRKEAVDWPVNVAGFIVECANTNGIPMFRTRFGGRRFDGLVLGICWGVRGAVPSRWFRNVPPEDLQHLEEGPGDWTWLLQKYGTEEQQTTQLTPEALKAFAEKRIPALAAARKRKPKTVTLVVRRERMGAVDRLAWRTKVEPALAQVDSEVESHPEAFIIHIAPEAARQLSDGIWSILIEWGEKGTIEDAVEGRIEDLINQAIENLPPTGQGTEGRAPMDLRNVMQHLIQGRKPDVFLAEGLVVSARANRGRAELGIEDGSGGGTLILIVSPEHLPPDLESAIQREDSVDLEALVIGEEILAPVRPTTLFLRAVSDAPLHIGPTSMHAHLEPVEEAT